MRPSTKRYLFKLTISFLIIYLMFRPVWRSATFDTVIEGAKAQRVWEFVSDLSDSKKLNPSIYKFDIVRESGNFDHWEYGAVIYETMSRIPLLTNINYADFIAKPLPTQNGFIIDSKYKTCFFGYACLLSTSEMVFSKAGESTKFRETVNYQCPFSLTWICSQELNDQRLEWMKRLNENFRS